MAQRRGVNNFQRVSWPAEQNTGDALFRIICKARPEAIQSF